MKKILLAVNAQKPGSKILEFAAYIGRMTNATLSIIFLENLVAEERIVVRGLYGVTYLDWDIDEDNPEHKVKMQLIENNIQSYREACDLVGVHYSFQREAGQPSKTLVEESQFADLLIMDADLTFKKSDEDSPSKFVRHILEYAGCPVMITPANFHHINEVVFAYDESQSSLFAIRQFSYLFPAFSELPLRVIHVSKESSWDNEKKVKLDHLLKSYYSNITYQIRTGDAEDELLSYGLKLKDIVVVMGAYGRSQFSNFLHHSTAELVIKSNKHPIFITHK